MDKLNDVGRKDERPVPCAVTYSNPLLGMYNVVRIPTRYEVRVLALNGEEIQPTKMEYAGNRAGHFFLGWSTVHV